jgi:hypothetical protein
VGLTAAAPDAEVEEEEDADEGGGGLVSVYFSTVPCKRTAYLAHFSAVGGESRGKSLAGTTNAASLNARRADVSKGARSSDGSHIHIRTETRLPGCSHGSHSSRSGV